MAWYCTGNKPLPEPMLTYFAETYSTPHPLPVQYTILNECAGIILQQDTEVLLKM